MKKYLVAAFLIVAAAPLGGCSFQTVMSAYDAISSVYATIKSKASSVRTEAQDKCTQLQQVAALAYNAGNLTNSCKWEKIAIQQYEGVKAFCNNLNSASDNDIKVLVNSVKSGLSAAKTAQAAGC